MAGAVREGVETGVHYPQPLHRQPAFEGIADMPALPTAEWLSERVLSLPVHPSLTDGDLQHVVESMKRVIG